jgi:hypothetical protein
VLQCRIGKVLCSALIGHPLACMPWTRASTAWRCGATRVAEVMRTRAPQERVPWPRIVAWLASIAQKALLPRSWSGRPRPDGAHAVRRAFSVSGVSGSVEPPHTALARLERPPDVAARILVSSVLHPSPRATSGPLQSARRRALGGGVRCMGRPIEHKEAVC